MNQEYFDKFFQKVVIKEGCWDWKDRPFKNGYPYLQVGRKGKKEKASRVSFFIYNGYLPAVVRHDCDNPICTNPEHLTGGTQWDNVNDRRIRGRARNQFTSATHCLNGHEFTEENTYLWYYKGKLKQRQCKTCNKNRLQRNKNRGDAL